MEETEVACMRMNQSKHPAAFFREMTLSAFGATVHTLFSQPCTHGIPDHELERQYVGDTEGYRWLDVHCLSGWFRICKVLELILGSHRVTQVQRYSRK